MQTICTLWNCFHLDFQNTTFKIVQTYFEILFEIWFYSLSVYKILIIWTLTNFNSLQKCKVYICCIAILMLLQARHVFNPLSPDIKMHILFTILHTFLMELVRRICPISRHLILGDHFLYSYHLNVWTSSDNVKRNFILNKWW